MPAETMGRKEMANQCLEKLRKAIQERSYLNQTWGQVRFYSSFWNCQLAQNCIYPESHCGVLKDICNVQLAYTSA